MEIELADFDVNLSFLFCGSLNRLVCLVGCAGSSCVGKRELQRVFFSHCREPNTGPIRCQLILTQVSGADEDQLDGTCSRRRCNSTPLGAGAGDYFFVFGSVQ